DRCLPSYTGVDAPEGKMTPLGLERRYSAADRQLFNYDSFWIDSPVQSHWPYAIAAVAVAGPPLWPRRPAGLAVGGRPCRRAGGAPGRRAGRDGELLPDHHRLRLPLSLHPGPLGPDGGLLPARRSDRLPPPRAGRLRRGLKARDPGVGDREVGLAGRHEAVE